MAVFIKDVIKTIINSFLLILLEFLISFSYDLINPLSFTDKIPWNSFIGYLEFFLGKAHFGIDIYFYFLSCVVPFWIILSISTSIFCRSYLSHICGLIITLSLIALLVNGPLTTILIICVSLICLELLRKIRNNKKIISSNYGEVQNREESQL
jgi:hypothetical protein